MVTIPRATRRSKFSWKTNQARKAVNTPSALSNREAPEAGIRARPSSSKTGATTPPARMAPASQPHSSPGRDTAGTRQRRRSRRRPRPEPRYSRAASSQGLVWTNSSLANGGWHRKGAPRSELWRYPHVDLLHQDCSRSVVFRWQVQVPDE